MVQGRVIIRVVQDGEGVEPVRVEVKLVVKHVAMLNPANVGVAFL